MSYIVTRTDKGRRAVYIAPGEAAKRVEEGSADVIRKGILYVDRQIAKPPEDLDSVVDEEQAEPLVYETREMKAEPKPAPRRRGRPRKAKPAATAAEKPQDG
jgi:predicted ribosome-associated RNA-binding protein Tma20